jgi:hypothetical protein
MLVVLNSVTRKMRHGGEYTMQLGASRRKIFVTAGFV